MGPTHLTRLRNGLQDQLAARAALGDHHAAVLLARSAAGDGKVDEAVTLLDPGLRAEDRESVRAMATIRYQQRNFTDAAEIVRPFAESGEGWAVQVHRAIKVTGHDFDWLRENAAAGDIRSKRAIVRLHSEDGDIQALAKLALDDEFAALVLDRMRLERGHLAALWTRAETGNHYAAWLLANALAERVDIPRLTELVSTGAPIASGALARLLRVRMDEDALEVQSSENENVDCTVALALLRAESPTCGTVDELLAAVPQLAEQLPMLFDQPQRRTLRELTADLRTRQRHAEPSRDKDLLLARASVEVGSKFQHQELLRTLRVERDIPTLTWLTSIGRDWAAIPLAKTLLEGGDVDAALSALSQAADDGNAHAAANLADLLSRIGRAEELRERAATGDYYAASRLATFLATEDGMKELVIRARGGDAFAMDAALERLHDPANRPVAVDLLKPWVDAGSAGAAQRLSALYELDGELDEATRVIEPFAAEGDLDAARRITELAYVRGDIAALRELADSGDRHAAQRLATLLFKNGDVMGLVHEVAANNTDDAARHLLRLHQTSAEWRRHAVYSLDPLGVPDIEDVERDTLWTTAVGSAANDDSGAS